MSTRVYHYHTTDVFTDRPLAGNQLAVVLDATGLSSAEMQAIAAEFNYSETTFVLPPADPSHTAHVRIFTPGAELPFAGHPNVGTAFVLATLGTCYGRLVGNRLLFEEAAGLVPVDRILDGDNPVGATLTAPVPLTTGSEAPVAAVAAAISLEAADIATARHAPIVASVGAPFLMVELTNRAALARAVPMRSLLSSALPDGAHGIHAYVPATDAGDIDIRARMFAVLDGITEDPATGSANAALVALLSQLLGGPEPTFVRRIAQGVEMGRPSLLVGTVHRSPGTTQRVQIGGRCVTVMQGVLHLPST
jgi:trans-2,3-dihydro-3-hydroxyanthranilate isomerase